MGFSLSPAIRMEGQVVWIQKQYRDARKAIALRTLEGKLAKIITISNGHRKNGLPKHAPAYQALAKQAVSLIDTFCLEYSVDQDEVYAQIPAMTELKELGSPAPAEMNPAGRIVAGILGVIFGLIVAGFLTGAIQRLFHLGWTIAHYHR